MLSCALGCDTQMANDDDDGAFGTGIFNARPEVLGDDADHVCQLVFQGKGC